MTPEQAERRIEEALADFDARHPGVLSPRRDPLRWVAGVAVLVVLTAAIGLAVAVTL